MRSLLLLLPLFACACSESVEVTRVPVSSNPIQATPARPNVIVQRLAEQLGEPNLTIGEYAIGVGIRNWLIDGEILSVFGPLHHKYNNPEQLIDPQYLIVDMRNTSTGASGREVMHAEEGCNFSLRFPVGKFDEVDLFVFENEDQLQRNQPVYTMAGVKFEF